MAQVTARETRVLRAIPGSYIGCTKVARAVADLSRYVIGYWFTHMDLPVLTLKFNIGRGGAFGKSK